VAEIRNESEIALDRQRDLEIGREIDAPLDLVWRCWTYPELLARWWAPEPLRTQVATLDFRAGGAFVFSMTTPDGAVHNGSGVFLEVVPQRRVVFTDALTEGWRPAEAPFVTAIMNMVARDGLTHCAVRVLHSSAAQCERHKSMGFQDAWPKCLAQLEATAKSLAS
jgi:uncharacterized protein YndB with AHSA1/START domain